MTEFALVAPVLFFLLLGIIDSTMLLFSIGSARFAAGEGARQASESGNAADADAQILLAVRRTALGQTKLATVNHVDIYRLVEQANGALTVDNARYNTYRLDGTPVGAINWPPPSRNVTNGQSDFLGITINYTYSWKSGIFVSPNSLQLTQTYSIRLEPQTY